MLERYLWQYPCIIKIFTFLVHEYILQACTSQHEVKYGQHKVTNITLSTFIISVLFNLNVCA